MCLIVCAFHHNPDYPLVVSANRDEFHDRPTRNAGFWADSAAPGLLAGRDMTQGGTWLGITRTGRFAAVTNVRTPNPKPGARSRGFLTSEFLRGAETPHRFLTRIQASMGDYAPFNLLVGDLDSLFYLTNNLTSDRTDGEIRALAPGVYGLSNGFLDADWPKVRRGKARVTRLLDGPGSITTDALIDIMTDRNPAPDDELPDTGVPRELERRLSSSFISNPERQYGTRCSTGIVVERNGRVRFSEQNYGADTAVTSRLYFEFPLLSA
jgi:uncharacterized protein with NRDE domain